MKNRRRKKRSWLKTGGVYLKIILVNAALSVGQSLYRVKRDWDIRPLEDAFGKQLGRRAVQWPSASAALKRWDGFILPGPSGNHNMKSNQHESGWQIFMALDCHWHSDPWVLGNLTLFYSHFKSCLQVLGQSRQQAGNPGIYSRSQVYEHPLYWCRGEHFWATAFVVGP